MRALFRGGIIFGLMVLVIAILISSCSDDPVDNTVPPVIIDVTPQSGPVGSVVAITGTNFGTSYGTNTVMFNGTPATVKTFSATQLSVTVPSGATTGKVSVTVKERTATSPLDFTVN